MMLIHAHEYILHCAETYIINTVGILLHNSRCLFSTIYPSEYPCFPLNTHFITMLRVNIEYNIKNFHNYMAYICVLIRDSNTWVQIWSVVLISNMTMILIHAHEYYLQCAETHIMNSVGILLRKSRCLSSTIIQVNIHVFH